MTSGNPIKLILRFMLPLFIGNLFQQLYNMADTFIVGRELGSGALAAVGSTGSVMFLILGFAMGCTSGLSMLTAQRFGAGDMDAVRKSFAVSCVIGFVIAAVLTGIGVPLARPILTLLRTPADIIDDAYSYSVLIFAGILAVMLFNVVSSVMRAVGDSRTPLIFLVLACLLNIALDYLFILAFGMGVAGAAIATVIAQLVSGLTCMAYIYIKIPALRLTRKDWVIRSDDVWEHIRVGLPMGFQMSIISVGAILVQFALNGLGSVAVAGFTTALKISNIAMLPLMSFGVTMGTFAAQNYGAGEYRRILRGVIQCSAVSLSFSVIIGVVSFMFGGVFAAFFVTDSPEAVALAHQALKIEGFMYWSLALLFIFRYSMQGIGHSFIPTLAGFVELIMRAAAAAFLSGPLGFAGVAAAGPLAWLGAFIVLSVAFVLTMRKMLACQDRPDDGGDGQNVCQCLTEPREETV